MGPFSRMSGGGSSSAGANSDEISGLLAVLVEFRCKRGQTYFVPAVGADIDMSAFGNSKPIFVCHSRPETKPQDWNQHSLSWAWFSAGLWGNFLCQTFFRIYSKKNTLCQKFPAILLWRIVSWNVLAWFSNGPRMMENKHLGMGCGISEPACWRGRNITRWSSSPQSVGRSPKYPPVHGEFVVWERGSADFCLILCKAGQPASVTWCEKPSATSNRKFD